MTSRRSRGLAAAGLGLLTLLLAAAPAAATAPPATIVVRRVDTTAMPKVTVDVQTGTHTLGANDTILVENGKKVAVSSVQSLGDAQVATATVLVVDTAQTMNGAKMFAARLALKQLISAKGPADQMAVVAFGTHARTVQGFTADPTALDAAVDRLAVGGNAVLNDGILLGANLLSALPTALPQLVVIGDSSDKGSNATVSAAQSDLLSSNALTYVVGLRFTSGVDLSGLSAFATAGRGAMFTGVDPGTTPDAMRQVIDAFHGQYRITYQSSIATGHAADLVITAPGLTGQAQVVPGGVAIGLATDPAPVHLVQAPGLLRGKAGLLLVAILVLAAAGLLTYAGALLLTREGSALSAALVQFSEPKNGDDGEGSMIQTAFIQRAVDATGKFARERGLLEIVEAKLEQADLVLRPAEALFVYLIAAVLVTALALFAGGPVLALIALAFVIIAPPAILNFLAARRLRKFTSQLPDMLQLLASSLRAGFSFLQGVEAVAQEVDDPMGAELRRVIVEARLGRPVETSLDECAARMKSEDFDWAVMAVNIQREVGGNLADLLQTVGVTMIERERLRRDVKSLTAEGRMSAIVLGCLPPGLAVVFYTTNPAYIRVLFTHLGGQIALGCAVAAMVAGFFWMKKIVDIKV